MGSHTRLQILFLAWIGINVLFGSAFFMVGFGHEKWNGLALTVWSFVIFVIGTVFAYFSLRLDGSDRGLFRPQDFALVIYVFTMIGLFVQVMGAIKLWKETEDTFHHARLEVNTIKNCLYWTSQGNKTKPISIEEGGRVKNPNSGTPCETIHESINF